MSATNSSGITEIDGAIGDTSVGDAGGLKISGSGQSVLTVANSYAGLTEVDTGSTLVIENGQALGTTAAGTQLDYDATLELEGSITVTGEALTAGTYDVITSVGANVWTGNMSSSSELYVDVASGNSLEVDGNVTGNYLYNNNAGQLTLDGSANVIQYQVENEGILEVDGGMSVPFGSLYNYGTLQGTGTVNIGEPYYSVYSDGTLSPGTTGTPGIFTANQFDFQGGSFNVLLNGDTTAGTDYSQLAVTGNVTLNGNLNVTLGYTPGANDSYVILDNQGSNPINGTFNGLPQGGLLVIGSDVFQISYTGGDGNDVVLTHTTADVWTGADGGPGYWSDPNNWAGDATPSPGDNLIFPDGAVQTTNYNDFTGAASAFGTIQISGSNYDLTGNQVSLAGPVISVGTGNSLDLDGLQLSTNGGIFNEGGTTFAVSSPIDLNGFNLSLGAASGATELDGIISDSSISDTGGLIIGGSGETILSNANTYAGLTTVNSGTLVIENAQALGTTAAGTDVENFAQLDLYGGITVTGEALTSSTSAEIGSAFDNTWNGSIAVTNDLEVYVDGGNSLAVGGNITGNYLDNNESGLLILGGSANVIQGEVQNSGVLEVDGTLSTPSGQVYNYSTLQGTGTLNGANAYLYNYGTLKPGLTNSSSAPGILNTGNFYQSSGENFDVRINGPGTAGTDYDQLSVTGSVQLNGNLNVTLGAGYTPTPGDSFTIINNDGADPINGTLNGLPEGGLLAVSSGPNTYFFQVSYVGGDGNDVVLTNVAVDTWTGGGGDNFWSDASNWSNGVPAATGDNLIFPDAAAQKTNDNDITGGMFDSIQITGSGYDLTGNAVSLSGGVASQGTGNTLALDSLTLTADGTISSTASSLFTVSSAIDVNSYKLSVIATSALGMTELDGEISGAGSLEISGPGKSVLDGPNTYTGLTTVDSGSTLVVGSDSGLGQGGTGNGTNLVGNATLELENNITVTGETLTSSASSDVSIKSVGNNVWDGDMTMGYETDFYAATGNSLEVNGNITGPYLFNDGPGQLTLDGSANVIQYYAENYGILEVDGTLSTTYYSVDSYSDGTLQGTGTIDSSTEYSEPIYNYGTLTPGTASAPGSAADVPGILNASYAVFQSTSQFNVILNGHTTAGTDYSQLDVTGGVTLNGSLNVTLGYTPSPGDQFTILNNESANAISGIFNGLPEGSLLFSGTNVFQITYKGGTGNDVVLTAIAADIWTGASLTSNHWSDGANWQSGFAPSPGDNLIFPAGALQTTNVNDFTGAASAFGTIQISGNNYDLTGNQVSLAGNIISAGTSNSLGLDLQLSAADGIINTNSAGATFTVSGTIDLNGFNLLVSATDSAGITELDGQISGAGGLTIGGSGQSVLNTDNLYTGVTTVNSGTLVVENDSALGAIGTGNETDVENDATLQLNDFNGPITVTGELLTSATSASISSVGANVWSGDISVAEELDADVTTGNSLEVVGNITGNYLYNNDAGQLTLDGSDNAIQYETYNYGVLEVDGTFNTSGSELYNDYGGTLQGTGTINASTYSYHATVIPGTASLPGILTTNYIDFESDSNLDVLLNGDTTAGTDYSQLAVTQGVTLDGNLNVTLGYTPGANDSYVIVNNEGSDPISGTFTGLPQGALLVVGSNFFQISYTGGDGNDVVLTHVTADVWTGASLTSNHWSDGANWQSGFAPNPGDNLLFPVGALQTTNVNDFTERTRLSARSRSRATTMT